MLVSMLTLHDIFVQKEPLRKLSLYFLKTFFLQKRQEKISRLNDREISQKSCTFCLKRGLVTGFKKHRV